jgi:hypothetical protein
MESLSDLLYLFFRLSPFIIACFFSLISVFNSDIKGFIYLVGLIATTALTMLSGTGIENAGMSLDANVSYANVDSTDSTSQVGTSTTTKTETKAVCNTLSLGGYQGFSKVPLGLAVLSYSFFYLVYTIAKYNMAIYNIPTLILFPVLILADIWWNIYNSCYSAASCIISIIVAGGLGVGWSAIVNRYMPNMQYLIVGSNREMCMKPSDQTFICEDVS